MVYVERKTHRESWKGEESVKERFELPEEMVFTYLQGQYTLQEALADMTTRMQVPQSEMSLDDVVVRDVA